MYTSKNTFRTRVTVVTKKGYSEQICSIIIAVMSQHLHTSLPTSRSPRCRIGPRLGKYR